MFETEKDFEKRNKFIEKISKKINKKYSDPSKRYGVIYERELHVCMGTTDNGGSPIYIPSLKLNIENNWYNLHKDGILFIKSKDYSIITLTEDEYEFFKRIVDILKKEDSNKERCKHIYQKYVKS